MLYWKVQNQKISIQFDSRLLESSLQTANSGSAPEERSLSVPDYIVYILWTLLFMTETYLKMSDILICGWHFW